MLPALFTSPDLRLVALTMGESLPASLLIIALLGSQGQIPDGSGQLTIALRGTSLDLFTYKPSTYRDGPLIVVFHGVLRNADEYRDHARSMGDRFGALIVAPRFPEKEFPTSSYQEGGLIIDGKLRPRDEWTWQLVPALVDEVRKRAGRPEMPYYFIGHSGGGQFLIRLPGFVPPEAKRIVVSNPGTYLFPSRELPYPFGFGGLPDEISNDDALRRFLAQPITLYLGMEDTIRDEYFNTTPPAEQQGKTRWERGQNAYRAAQELARRQGWTCNWKLVVVEGVGHDHQAMFDHARCKDALFGP